MCMCFNILFGRWGWRVVYLLERKGGVGITLELKKLSANRTINESIPGVTEALQSGSIFARNKPFSPNWSCPSTAYLETLF